MHPWLCHFKQFSFVFNAHSFSDFIVLPSGLPPPYTSSAGSLCNGSRNFLRQNALHLQSLKFQGHFRVWRKISWSNENTEDDCMYHSPFYVSQPVVMTCAMIAVQQNPSGSQLNTLKTAMRDHALGTP